MQDDITVLHFEEMQDDINVLYFDKEIPSKSFLMSFSLTFNLFLLYYKRSVSFSMYFEWWYSGILKLLLDFSFCRVFV